MRRRPVSSQLDQVLPRSAVQEASSDHSFGRIRFVSIGKRASGFSKSRGIRAIQSAAFPWHMIGSSLRLHETADRLRHGNRVGGAGFSTSRGSNPRPAAFFIPPIRSRASLNEVVRYSPRSYRFCLPLTRHPRLCAPKVVCGHRARVLRCHRYLLYSRGTGQPTDRAWTAFTTTIPLVPRGQEN
jgi:hypothetical protein